MLGKALLINQNCTDSLRSTHKHSACTQLENSCSCSVHQPIGTKGPYGKIPIQTNRWNWEKTELTLQAPKLRVLLRCEPVGFFLSRPSAWLQTHKHSSLFTRSSDRQTLYLGIRNDLTGISWSQVVGVACKEGLMVLCWQIHVVVGQRLSTRYPCITRQKRERSERSDIMTGLRHRCTRKCECDFEKTAMENFLWLAEV